MIRRLIILACVAILSGLSGTVAGILIAPAPGSETRKRMSGFVEQHGDVVTETVQQGRQFIVGVVEFFTSGGASPGDL